LHLLGQHGLLRRGADDARLARDLAEAVTSKVIRRTDTFYSTSGTSWAMQVTPVFQTNELLFLVLVWEQLSVTIFWSGLDWG